MERSGLGDETYLPEGMHVLAVWICVALPCLMDKCLYHNSVSAICRLDHWSMSAICFHHHKSVSRICFLYHSHWLSSSTLWGMCLVHTMSEYKQQLMLQPLDLQLFSKYLLRSPWQQLGKKQRWFSLTASATYLKRLNSNLARLVFTAVSLWASHLILSYHM